jgi:signal transduction histidine kinase
MQTNIKIDWRKYLLSVFNLVQNAVKYNKEGGSVMISFELRRDRDNNPSQYLFRTEITNTGQEISPDRISSMMKIFGELNKKKSIHLVKD